MDKKKAKTNSTFIREVTVQSERKIRSQKNPNAAWFGLGMMGLIGWSVIVPTLIGAIIGNWLDKRYQQDHSWTLALLILGLCIGCINAWFWMSRQHLEMQPTKDDSDE